MKKIEAIRKDELTLILKSITEVGNLVLRIENNCIDVKLLIFGGEFDDGKILELSFDDDAMQKLRDWLSILYDEIVAPPSPVRRKNEDS